MTSFQVVDLSGSLAISWAENGRIQRLKSKVIPSPNTNAGAGGGSFLGKGMKGPPDLLSFQVHMGRLQMGLYINGVSPKNWWFLTKTIMLEWLEDH